MQKHLRETLRALKEAGVRSLVVKQNCHFKVSWHDTHGRKVSLVLSTTPSDRNAIHMNRRRMRRLLTSSDQRR
jgi:hypothetical protein